MSHFMASITTENKVHAYQHKDIIFNITLADTIGGKLTSHQQAVSASRSSFSERKHAS